MALIDTPLPTARWSDALPHDGSRDEFRDGRALARGARTLAEQLGLVLVAALIYFGVRGLTEGSVATAVANAHDVVDLERSLGVDVEHALQARVLGHHWLVTAANWVYIWGHWPVIAATFVWLHRRDVATYRWLRNAMFVSGAIGLIVFARFPVAPPRLADLGFVDTVTQHSNSYRVLQPPALVNKYAAVPSLHVGWNFLVGVFVWRTARRRWVRWIGAVSPMAMFAAVVLTGNHYVLDGLVGILVATVGLVIAGRFRRPSADEPGGVEVGRAHSTVSTSGRPSDRMPDEQPVCAAEGLGTLVA